MNLIVTENLTKRFGTLTAVDNLSFSVNSGEIFGIVGPDGAGKTTVMRLLASIMDPTSGKIWIDGMETAANTETIKERVSYMSQKFGLYSDLTVRENMDFYAEIYGVRHKKKHQRIEELLAFSHLTPFSERLAENLSGGMKQKLGLCCALIHTPKILFLDEPTNGVDPVTRRDFWRILYELHRQGTTIVFTTSYLDEAERCNKVAFMYQGKLLSMGTPKEVKKHLEGSILEIQCKAPRKAMLKLREMLGYDCVKLFGNRIHIYIYTEHPKTSIVEVEKGLIEAGLTDYAIRHLEPTLEDVFMSLMNDKGKEDDDVAY